jgi:hypothetical protein
MSRCYVEDAGVSGAGGTQAIELMATREYVIEDCVIGRNREDQVTGTHFHAMLDTMPDDDGTHKWSAGYSQYQHNVITGNVFDGSAAPDSTFTLRGGANVFTGNTVIQRVCQGVLNSDAPILTDNDIRAVASDGVSLSSSVRAFWIADSRNAVIEGNTFRSKYGETTLVSTDYDSPTGPAKNIRFVGNTFVKDSGDAAVYCEGMLVQKTDGTHYQIMQRNATGGTFTISVDGKTTNGIAYNAAASAVLSALTAADVPASAVSGAGTSGDPWVVTFSVAPTTVRVDASSMTGTQAQSDAYEADSVYVEA